MKTFRKVMLLLFVGSVLLLPQFCQAASDTPPVVISEGVPVTLDQYFVPAQPGTKATDPDGFIQRWLLLEPIKQDIRTNAIFTESYVRNAFNTEFFPNQFTVVPKNGDTVTVNGKELKWHALDSKRFNAKLFRFASCMNLDKYGVIFWAVTIVESPEDMEVRMSVGSNSASIWWLNDKEAVALFNDRRMVADDCMSKRLILKKGKNVIRGAVINGPGMSDFCVRFVDENGKPIKNLKVNLGQ